MILAFEGEGVGLIQQKAKVENSGLVWVVKGPPGFYLNNKKCHSYHAIRPKGAPTLKYWFCCGIHSWKNGWKFESIKIHITQEGRWSACHLKFELPIWSLYVGEEAERTSHNSVRRNMVSCEGKRQWWSKDAVNSQGPVSLNPPSGYLWAITEGPLLPRLHKLQSL